MTPGAIAEAMRGHAGAWYSPAPRLSAHGTHRPSSSAGFSLLELLLVMSAMIALVEPMKHPPTPMKEQNASTEPSSCATTSSPIPR